MRHRVARTALGLALAMSLTPVASVHAAEAKKQHVNIKAMNYHFMGIPKTLKAGKVVFTFENEGTEMHEAAIFRLLHGKTVKQLLAMPQKKAEEHIEIIGGLFAKPGKWSKKELRADLVPGRYASLCFVPAEDKEPHFAKGMIHKFKVVK